MRPETAQKALAAVPPHSFHRGAGLGGGRAAVGNHQLHGREPGAAGFLLVQPGGKRGNPADGAKRGGDNALLFGRARPVLAGARRRILRGNVPAAGIQPGGRNGQTGGTPTGAAPAGTEPAGTEPAGTEPAAPAGTKPDGVDCPKREDLPPLARLQQHEKPLPGFADRRGEQRQAALQKMLLGQGTGGNGKPCGTLRPAAFPGRRAFRRASGPRAGGQRRAAPHAQAAAWDGLTGRHFL